MNNEARAFSLGWLAKRELTAFQLEQKVRRRFPAMDDSEVSMLLSELVERGYIDDDRVAGMLLRAALRSNKGPLYVRHSMRRAGIDDEMVDRHIVNVESWAPYAEASLHKRFPALGPEIDNKALGRCYRYLHAQGFTTDVVREAIRVHCQKNQQVA